MFVIKTYEIVSCYDLIHNHMIKIDHFWVVPLIYIDYIDVIEYIFKCYGKYVCVFPFIVCKTKRNKWIKTQEKNQTTHSLYLIV